MFLKVLANTVFSYFQILDFLSYILCLPFLDQILSLNPPCLLAGKGGQGGLLQALDSGWLIKGRTAIGQNETVELN